MRITEQLLKETCAWLACFGLVALTVAGMVLALLRLAGPDLGFRMPGE